MYQSTDLTKKIIELFYKVYNTLGYGFLKKVYQNALFYELQKADLKCSKQKQIKVYYDELVLNFGKKPEFKRKYFSNTNKKIRENHA